MKTADNTFSVFLVDDDAMFLTALKHKLVDKFKSGVKIRTFSDGEECLRHMEDKPDLVVLDYYLDHDSRKTMNGMEVLQKIKSASDETTVVMLSSSEKKELADESVRNGAYKYVSKKDASGHQVQNLVKNIIHDTLLDRETKENKRFNLIMGGSFFAVVGIVIYIYIKYFY